MKKHTKGICSHSPLCEDDYCGCEKYNKEQEETLIQFSNPMKHHRKIMSDIDKKLTDSTIINLGTIVYTKEDLDRIKNEEKELQKQSNQLWKLCSYALGLFILGYMTYHFIRFLLMPN